MWYLLLPAHMKDTGLVKLDKLRDWARGSDVKGLPRKSVVRPGRAILNRMAQVVEGMAKDGLSIPPAEPPPPTGYKPKYKIDTTGTDALISFGKHRGKTLSEIGKKDFTYLDFIIKDDFPADLKDVARHVKKCQIEKSAKIRIFEEDDG